MSGASAGVAGVWRGCRPRQWLVALLLAAYVLTSAPAAAQARGQPVRILLLYGVSPELPEVVNFTKQLRAAMRSDAGRQDHGPEQSEYLHSYLQTDNTTPGLCAKYEPASAGLFVSACDESRTAPFLAVYLQGMSRSIQAMRVRSL